MQSPTRVHLSVRVTRQGQVAPVRKPVGLRFDADASFADVMSKALRFGTSAVSEDVTVHRYTSSVLEITQTLTVIALQDEALLALQGGSVAMFVSTDFAAPSAQEIESDGLAGDVIGMWQRNCVEFCLPRVAVVQPSTTLSHPLHPVPPSPTLSYPLTPSPTLSRH